MGEQRVTIDQAHALDRLGKRIASFEPGDTEMGCYFMLCMASLAMHAPEVCTFLLDRANEHLGYESDSSTRPGNSGGSAS